MSLFKKIFAMIKKQPKSTIINEAKDESSPYIEQTDVIHTSLNDNLSFIKTFFDGDTSVTQGKFNILNGNLQAGLVYVDSMTNTDMINQQIISRLQNVHADLLKDGISSIPKSLQIITKSILSTVQITEYDNMKQAISQILIGHAALFIEGSAIVLIIHSRKLVLRAIGKPEIETTILGSKEAFIEDIDINCVMLRKRLPIPNLKFQTFEIGRLSKTTVKLAWIEGIINPKVIEEVRTRLTRIDVDYVFGIAMLAELIEDDPLSMWPQHKLTERPDILAPNMTDGRFAIFCDNSPFAFIAPICMSQNMQTYDDYAEKPIIGTFLRFVRDFGILISMFLTPLYLAFVAYNHTILPPNLAQQIASGRESVPFPSIFEVSAMSLVIDLLREAGVRLPKAVGSAIGILGAVVIGQAAVTAGYVSPALIIVIAISAISSFAIPNEALSSAVRIANYFLLLCASFLGLFGVIAGGVFILLKIVSLRSFGIPLFYPIAPTESSGWLDILIRAPIWMLRKRPSLLAPNNISRMGATTTKPSPKQGGEK